MAAALVTAGALALATPAIAGPGGGSDGTEKTVSTTTSTTSVTEANAAEEMVVVRNQQELNEATTARILGNLPGKIVISGASDEKFIIRSGVHVAEVRSGRVILRAGFIEEVTGGTVYVGQYQKIGSVLGGLVNAYDRARIGTIYGGEVHLYHNSSWRLSGGEVTVHGYRNTSAIRSQFIPTREGLSVKQVLEDAPDDWYEKLLQEGGWPRG